MSQQTTLDWKLHDVGKVRQVVTNTGGWNAKFDNLFDFPGLINCEYPPNTFEEHITEAGLWIGAVVGGDTLVSVAQGEGSSREFYPTPEPWDSIWVVQKGDTVDIPYWPDYVGISDQDFVCRYNDYGVPSLRVTNHKPLHLEVIQVSHAWSSYPLDEIIMFKYYIIARKTDLHQVVLTSWINGNVGNTRDDTYGLDDITFFRMNRRIQVCVDLPGGGDGDAIGAVATKVFPPPASSGEPQYSFVFYNGRQEGLPAQDALRYQQMSSWRIMNDQSSTGDGTKSMISVGPYDLSVGDTLVFMVGLILGEGVDAVYENADRLDWLKEQDFGVPSPPPSPVVYVKTDDRKVVLNWKPQPGDVNPELYTDPYRADEDPQPFEGYRIYKSTQSASGPWTLLAQFDIAGNEFESNTGLQYEYVDTGLLNNLEYFYTVTSFSKPDTVMGFPDQESSRNSTAKKVIPGTAPPESVGEVAVVPNPYRGDIAYNAYNPPWEKPDASRSFWLEQDRRIQFINLPAQCEIKVYTLSGDLVKIISHSDPNRGYEDWNLTSSVGQAIASGIYLFSVEDLKTNRVQVGKFVIVK